MNGVNAENAKGMLADQGAMRLGLILLALGGLYYPVFLELLRDWAGNDNYSHGYFIPLISGYMIFSARGELQKETVAPWNWGLLLFLAGLGLLAAAKVASLNFAQAFSLLVVLWGLSLYLWGPRYAARIFVPIAYLLFMIPLPGILWNKIAFPMQLFSSAVTEQLVRLFGVSILREGNVLSLAQTTLEVVDACSGLRSLTTMCALSAALAWFCRGALWRRWLLFLAAFPIAILINVIRLTATALLASRYGEEVAQGFLHEFSGILVFVLGLVLLWGAYVLLGDERK